MEQLSILLSIVLAIIFLVLSLFHVYWVFGGKYGLEAAIPTSEGGQAQLNPPLFMTALVALVLFSFSMLYLLRSGMISISLSSFIDRYMYYVVPILFLLRTIGEFKYVGLFKKIKSTTFAKADTKLFVPLCAFIGVVGLWLALS